jgi:ferredoxin
VKPFHLAAFSIKMRGPRSGEKRAMTETTFTVEILPDRVKVRARAGEVLADVITGAGIPLSLYCHQRGLCGKCAVRILRPP